MQRFFIAAGGLEHNPLDIKRLQTLEQLVMPTRLLANRLTAPMPIHARDREPESSVFQGRTRWSDRSFAYFGANRALLGVGWSTEIESPGVTIWNMHIEAAIRRHLTISAELPELPPDFLAAARDGAGRLTRAAPAVAQAIGISIPPPAPQSAVLAGNKLRGLVHGHCGTEPMLSMLAVLGRTQPSGEVDRLATELVVEWVHARGTPATAVWANSTVDAGLRQIRQWAEDPKSAEDLIDTPNRIYELALETLRAERVPIERLRGQRGNVRESTLTSEVPNIPPDERNAPAEHYIQPDEGSSNSAARGASASKRRRVRARLHRATIRNRLGSGQSHRYARRARNASTHVLPVSKRTQIQPYDRAVLHHYQAAASTTDRAVIASVLYSSQGLDALAGWRIVVDQAVLADIETPTCLVLDPLGLAVLNGINPVLPQPLDRPVPATRVFLPFPCHSSHPVAALRDHVGARRDGLVFTEQDIDAARLGLRTFARSRHSPLSLERLARELPIVAFDVTGRRPMEHYFRPPSSIEPAFLSGLHYNVYRLDEIEQIFSQVVGTLDRKFFVARRSGEAKTVSTMDNTIGSRFCPHKPDLINFIGKLESRIPPLRRGRPNREAVALLHNALTDYVIAMFFAGSGVRPFALGFASLRPVLGHWLVNEKPQSGPTVRRLPVPPLAARQWAFYEQHREFVLRQMSGDPSSVDKVPIWFYLDAEGETITPVTPATWRNLMTPEVANALRHWLANALRRRGWRGDRVDLLMGHHPRGTEPGEAWSAIEVAWTPAEVGDIEAAVTDLGFVARKGYGRG